MNWSIWQDFLKNRPVFRRRQLNQAVFQQLIKDWSQATALSLDDRQWLSNNCPLTIDFKLVGQLDESAQKAQLKLFDDQTVETVLLNHNDGRQTVCLSSQVGCPLGCLFCETGQQGFRRNLTAGEIVEQVLLWQRLLSLENKRVDNLVFMGMGEPLLNFNEVWSAIAWLHDVDSLAIGWRHIAISTVGLGPEIRQLIKYDQQIKLAWSLHAPNDKLRNWLMPINRRYNLATIKRAILEYTQKTNRRVMIEYLLLDQINDSVELAKQLSELLADFPKHLIVINLLTYNPGAGNFRPSTESARKLFINVLKRGKYKVTERLSLGQEIIGACGQLSGL